MPESANQAASGQRRANWVALRTLRQLPKAVGETAGGEPIYEVRSVQLLLDGAAGNFVRMAKCSRCGRELAGAPVLTAADLDRPLRPMICSDCIRSAGVSTVWDSEGGEPAGERPGPAALAASHPEPAPEPAPAPAADEAKRPERLQVMEGHLRAVTDRVNELGRVARAQRADFKEYTEREEATAAALRDELASLRASTEDTRAEVQRLAEGQAEQQRLAEGQAEQQRLAGAQTELHRLADVETELHRLADVEAEMHRLAEAQAEGQRPGAGAGAELERLAGAEAEIRRVAGAQAELERRLAESPPAAQAGAAFFQLREEVAQLARLVEGQRGEVVGFVAAVSENSITTGELVAAQRAMAERLAGFEPSKVEELITTRVAEAESRLAERPPAEVDLSMVKELVASRVADAEARLAQRMASQRGDLETAVEELVDAYMAGFVRANDQLARGQSVLEDRIDGLADQVTTASRRMEALLERLAALEALAFQAPAPPAGDAPAGSFLDSLDRQLEAAARRLAARSDGGASRGEP